MGKGVNKNRLFHHEAICTKPLIDSNKHYPHNWWWWEAGHRAGGSYSRSGAQPHWESFGDMQRDWVDGALIHTCSACVHMVPRASSTYKMSPTAVFGKTFSICFKNNNNKRMVTQSFRGCSGVVCLTHTQLPYSVV